MSGLDDQPEYVVARINGALADRVGELGVHVTVTATNVLLDGVVASTERQAAVADVAREAAGGRVVHNQTTVMDYPEPVDSEALS